MRLRLGLITVGPIILSGLKPAPSSLTRVPEAKGLKAQQEVCYQMDLKKGDRLVNEHLHQGKHCFAVQYLVGVNGLYIITSHCDIMPRCWYTFIMNLFI